MDFQKIEGPFLSGMEVALLVFLVLLCLAVVGAMYRKWSGRTQSDVSGLRLKRRGERPAS